ncbi:MAG: SDR family NAD(P)-dependent oxidoreductase [Actinomycetota bacterium]|nr:SDR family NAD(P)-dependent oxidoreductase [Actinomycetota bacterium]
MELRGKRILLTGATGGLGRAIASSLAEEGASLVLSSRKESDLTEMEAGLPGDHAVLVSDLAEPGAGLELLSRSGDLDGMVANAGLPGTGKLDELTSENVERALRVNFDAPILMTQELLRALLAKEEGHIVLISSLSGVAVSPRSSIYNATKFGLRGFGLALREDLRGSGVGVSVVMPGFIRGAGMFADTGADAPPGMGTATPEAVGAGVVSAIHRDRSEVNVAPRRQVAAAKFAARHPELSGKLSNGPATKVAETMAGAQTEKR